MKSKNYDMVITSRLCDVTSDSEGFDIEKTDISIVSKNGKYGLCQTGRDEDEDGETSYLGRTVLACEYDNLFFLQSSDYTLLAAVSDGKQGLLKLVSDKCGDYTRLTVTKLLPCVYDSIETVRQSSKLLILHETLGRRWYNINDGKRSQLFDDIKIVSDCIAQCIKDEDVTLRNVLTNKIMYSVPEGWSCYKICEYDFGEIFKLIRNVEPYDENYRERLLYCVFDADRASLTPEATSITIYAQATIRKLLLTRIEMQWGNYDSTLDSKNFRMIFND